MKLIEHFVNGKIIPGSSDKKGKVFNPATGEQESEVRLASRSDLDSAVEVAKKAFETWSLKPALQRARIIFKFKELIEKNSDELTKLIVSEHGKVYEDARGSLTRGLEVVEFACGIPHLLKGEFSDGLRIKVFPQAIAIGNIHIGTIAGKLKGVIPATTPNGCLIDQLSTLVPTFSENSPFNKCGIPQANSTTSSPLVKEPLASS